MMFIAWIFCVELFAGFDLGGLGTVFCLSLRWD